MLAQKIGNIQNKLVDGLIDRERYIKLALLALLAGENCILLGPPGTAKSELARRLNSAVDESDYFEYLLTKFTTPDEIFGPISLKGLEGDEIIRKTEGYLPETNVAFLDEIFKANSAILNTLLTLLNERVFTNGRQKQDAPIRSIISASNELPGADETELHALYDRFLVRAVVDYIPEEMLTELIYSEDSFTEPTKEEKLSSTELDQIITGLKSVSIPENIAGTIIKIKKEIEQALANKNEESDSSGKAGASNKYGTDYKSVSDRRLKKALKLLKASAYTNGRNEVNILDVSLLAHCFWSDPQDAQTVETVVYENLPAMPAQGANKAEMIYEKWRSVFDEIFNHDEQEMDEDGNPLFIDCFGEIVTEATSATHTIIHSEKDASDLKQQAYRVDIRVNEYLYGYKDKDGDWLFKSSKVSKPVLDGEKDYLAIMSQRKRRNTPKTNKTTSYLKFKINNEVSLEHKGKIELCKGEIKDNYNNINEIYSATQKEKDAIENELSSHLWIEKEKLEGWLSESIKNYVKAKDIKEKYEFLMRDVDESYEAAVKAESEKKAELANR